MPTEIEIHQLMAWIDKIPLSRPKRNFSRDFSDGLLAAEVIKHFYPNLVELHNYPSANSALQKAQNWKILNTKVLKKIGIKLTEQTISLISNSTPNGAETAMFSIMKKVETIPIQSEDVLQVLQVDQVESDEESTIKMLQIKIEKLEKLVALKDMKIRQLQGS